jgi:hypothetical protein
MGASAENIAGLRRRGERRFFRRIEVRFGYPLPNREGFTRNVSSRGLFIVTRHVVDPGSVVQVIIDSGGTRIARWALVKWARRMPPELASILPSGMGLAVLDAGPDWIAAWTTKYRP